MWTAITALLIVMVGVAFLFIADLGFLKPQIEGRLTSASGRRFSIDGDLSIRVGRRTTVAASDIHWQNADWAKDRDMLQVGRLEIDVDLLSVFSGALVIERIEVHGAQVQLARNNDHESNWAMFDEQPADDEPSPAESRKIMLRQMDVSDVDILVIDPARPAPLDLTIRSLHQGVGEDDVLSASLDASSNGRELSIVGKLGTWTSLLEGGRVDYELEARLDRVLLTSNGYVDSLAEPRRPELEFSLKGPAISDLFLLMGLGQHGVGDVNLQGSLKPRDDGPLILEVDGNMGETTLDASGSFSDLQDLQQAELSARANGPSLGRILGLLGMHQIGEVPFALEIDVERSGPLMNIRQATLGIGDATLALQGHLPEFPSLGNASVTARADGPHLERLRGILPVPDRLSGPFSANLQLDATAGQNAFRINAQVPLGRLGVTGALGPPPEHFGSRAKFQFHGASLADIGAAFDVEDMADVPVSVAGQVELTSAGIQIEDAAIATVGEHQASVRGIVATKADLHGSNLDLQISGQSVADLGGMFYPVDGLPGEPYDIRAQLRIVEDGFRLQNVNSSIGESRLEADALVSRRRAFNGSRVSLSLQGPALETLVPAIGARQIKAGPFRLSGNLAIDNDSIAIREISFERESAALSGNVELAWPLSFDTATFDLRGRGQNIRALIGQLGPLQLDELPYSIDVSGTRDGSAWTVSALDLSLGEARAHASGTVDYGDAVRSTRLTVSSVIPGIARLGTVDGSRLRDRSISLDAELTGRERQLAIDNLGLQIDDGRIDGKVRFVPGPVPELHVDLRSDNLVLHPLAETDASTPPAAELSDGKLIPDTPVSLDALTSLNGSLTLRIGQFQRDNVRLQNVAFDDMTDPQSFGDRGNAKLALLELKRRGARDDIQAFDPCEHIEDFLGDTVGEIFLVAAG
ncbi:MAG: AsmA family protein [Woeseia sp.]